MILQLRVSSSLETRDNSAVHYGDDTTSISVSLSSRSVASPQPTLNNEITHSR